MRRAFFSSFLVAALISVSTTASAFALDTSWQAPQNLQVSSDSAAGVQYAAQVTKTKCGATIQLRTYKNNHWSKWKALACSKGHGFQFSSPTVTVDHTNQKAFVVWTQINQRTSQGDVVYRVTANKGKTFAKPQNLEEVTNRAPVGVVASADRGVLWAMVQKPESVIDQRPRFTLTPYRESNGQALQSNIVSNSRAFSADVSRSASSMRLFAGKGRVTAFWSLKDLTGNALWYAANTSSYNSANSAKRVHLAFHGQIAANYSFQHFQRGENSLPYRLTELNNVLSQTTLITVQQWSFSTHRFSDIASITIPLIDDITEAVAFGVTQAGQPLVAYLDPSAVLTEPQCYANYDGVHWCFRSIAPQNAPAVLYLQSFANGLPANRQGFIFPFSAQGVPGAEVTQWVAGPSGIEVITDLLGGGPRLIFEAGHETISSTGGIGLEDKLNVIVSDAFSL